jgi:hypothetical protein
MLVDTAGTFTAMLVKKTPFSAAERERLQAWVSRNKFLKVIVAPGVSEPRGVVYSRFLALGSARQEEIFVRAYPFDVAPVQDDRPFFFRTSFWGHTFSSDPMIKQNSPPVMEYTLLLLLAIISLAAAVCVYLPLSFLAARGRNVPRAARYGAFFAGIGLGYLAVEVALLQKFGLFLGHPNYALSIVLASMLFTTGLGSLFSGGIMARVGRLRFMSYVLAALLLLEYKFALPYLAGLIGLPFFARSLIVFALVAPIGLCLGVFFPTALDQLKPTAPSFVPWAWGINGIFSVLAPVLSVGLSMTWGMNALLLAAIPVYLVAGLCFPEAAP